MIFHLIFLGIITAFSFGVDYSFADSTETVVTVQMDGPSTFYSSEPNQIIRATVEIQNYTPSDGIYFLKITHLPTQIIIKDSELFPRPAANELWVAQIAFPFLESDIKFGDQTLFGEFEIHVRAEFASQTASTKFSIFEYRYGPESTPEPEPESQTQIDPPSLELDAGPSDQSTQKIPEWVRNIFIWYAEDQVSEDELLNAIQYLVQQEVITLE